MSEKKVDKVWIVVYPELRWQRDGIGMAVYRNKRDAEEAVFSNLWDNIGHEIVGDDEVDNFTHIDQLEGKQKEEMIEMMENNEDCCYMAEAKIN